MLKEISDLRGITYAGKIPFKNEGKIDISNEQRLEEFVTSRIALKEKLKVVLMLSRKCGN